jgi:uncharacterized membrane protein YdjX (TVP38/TMEM64 family)
VATVTFEGRAIAVEHRRREPKGKWLLRLGLLAALALSLTAGIQALGPWTPERLRDLLGALGPFAPAVFVGLFAALDTAGVPAPLLGAAAGLTLGLVPGAIATLAGMVLAACAQLLAMRHLAGLRLSSVRLPLVHRIEGALRRGGWRAVVAVRLLPGPFSEVNLAAGLTSLPVRAMAMGTLLGGAPKALGWAALGRGAADLPEIPPAGIAAAVIAAAAFGAAVWYRRRPKQDRALDGGHGVE